MTRENGIGDQEKTLRSAGSHFAQTKYQHHQASLEMEPTGEAEERETERPKMSWRRSTEEEMKDTGFNW